jgi:hypothetical protein
MAGRPVHARAANVETGGGIVVAFSAQEQVAVPVRGQTASRRRRDLARSPPVDGESGFLEDLRGRGPGFVDSASQKEDSARLTTGSLTARARSQG